MNDESEPITLCFHDLMSERVTLEAHESIDVSIKIPKDSELFIKRWDYRTILVTHSHKDNFGKHGTQANI